MPSAAQSLNQTADLTLDQQKASKPPSPAASEQQEKQHPASSILPASTTSPTEGSSAEGPQKLTGISEERPASQPEEDRSKGISSLQPTPLEHKVEAFSPQSEEQDIAGPIMKQSKGANQPGPAGAKQPEISPNVAATIPAERESLANHPKPSKTSRASPDRQGHGGLPKQTAERDPLSVAPAGPGKTSEGNAPEAKICPSLSPSLLPLAEDRSEEEGQVRADGSAAVLATSGQDEDWADFQEGPDAIVSTALSGNASSELNGEDSRAAKVLESALSGTSRPLNSTKVINLSETSMPATEMAESPREER